MTTKKKCVIVFGYKADKDVSIMEEYLKNPKIILLDHHESALDLHDPSKNRFVIPSMCGAKLTQRFLERCFNLDLSKFDNLIYLTQDYDLWIHSNKKSK